MVAPALVSLHAYLTLHRSIICCVILPSLHLCIAGLHYGNVSGMLKSNGYLEKGLSYQVVGVTAVIYNTWRFDESSKLC